ncbi:MAG: hypothetical protein SOV91_04640 [Eubacteriales bacterium]|nr:hypothetical protein [Eubacteriales bacterium]
MTIASVENFFSILKIERISGTKLETYKKACLFISKSIIFIAKYLVQNKTDPTKKWGQFVAKF